MDNMKAILIYLVVLGHLLECFQGTRRLFLYYTIYMFHMPAFVYVTGYFSKNNPERLLKKILYPYLICQLLYLLFQRFYLKQENQIQFSTPYWHLWYLFSLGCWLLLLQVIDYSKFSKKKVLGGAVLLALLVGFDKTIGYYMSLSRTIVFFPFFVMGRYKVLDNRNFRRWTLGGQFLLVGISECILWWKVELVRGSWLYYAAPYGMGGGIIWSRVVTLFLALIWICLLLRLIPDKEIKWFSSLGKYTFPVFLLHGFIVRWVSFHSVMHGSEVQNIVMSIVLAGVICAVLGNRWTDKILYGKKTPKAEQM